MISKQLKSIIESNIKLIEMNDFQTLFYLIEKRSGDRGELADILISAGVDFLSHMQIIPDFMFMFSEKLEEVVIPDNITEIGVGGFFSARNLTSVYVPNSVKHIGPGAFNQCKSLKQFIYQGSRSEFYQLGFRRGDKSDIQACFRFTPLKQITCSDGVITIS